MARLLFIVKQDNDRLYDYLNRQLSGEEGVEVILDRRSAERRQRVQAHEPERRKGDRRRLPVNEDDLRSYGFVVVRVAN